MHTSFLKLAACPICRNRLTTSLGELSDNRLWQGQLTCLHCGEEYPVRNGIPHLYVDDERWAPKAREAQGWIDYHKDKDIYDQTGVPIDFLLPYYDQEPWISVAKHFDVALDLMSLDGSETVLDLGAARTWAAKQFAVRGCEVIALDIVDDDQIGLGRGWALMEEAKVWYHLVVGDSENLPFLPDAFDYVFAAAVLHHTSDLPLLLRSVHQVLKPGGAVIAVNEPCISINQDPRHVLETASEELEYGINESRPNLFDYWSALDEAGFTSIDIFPVQAHSMRDQDLYSWALEMGVISPPPTELPAQLWPVAIAGRLRKMARRLRLGSLSTWRKEPEGISNQPDQHDFAGRANPLPPPRSLREELARAILMHRGGETCLLAQKAK